MVVKPLFDVFSVFTGLFQVSQVLFDFETLMMPLRNEFHCYHSIDFRKIKGLFQIVTIFPDFLIFHALQRSIPLVRQEQSWLFLASQRAF